MNRILINTCCALLLTTTTYAQNVGIGTAQPDASAALDINSSNKGLLIPRVDMLYSQPVNPATGLLVFNINPQFTFGIGYYYNAGSSLQPNWVQVLNQPQNFIRNQTVVQPNSNFHISNNGIIDGALTVGNSTSQALPLSIVSSSQSYTGISLYNRSSPGLWIMRVTGTTHNVPGCFQLLNTFAYNTSIITTGEKVGINMNTEPTATLDVNGDIKASGDFLIGMMTRRNDYTISGNSWSEKKISCPGGYQLITGGGGHRDWNSAVQDIELAYNGPDPNEPLTTWRIMVHNTSGNTRSMVIFCNCAKVK